MAVLFEATTQVRGGELRRDYSLLEAPACSSLCRLAASALAALAFAFFSSPLLLFRFLCFLRAIYLVRFAALDMLLLRRRGARHAAFEATKRTYFLGTCAWQAHALGYALRVHVRGFYYAQPKKTKFKFVF
jgi:hypothetical protein